MALPSITFAFRSVSLFYVLRDTRCINIRDAGQRFLSGDEMGTII